jgi:hypothetical protein
MDPKDMAHALGLIEQTDEQVAERIAKSRTLPWLNWEPLCEDILAVMRMCREHPTRPIYILPDRKGRTKPGTANSGRLRK